MENMQTHTQERNPIIDGIIWKEMLIFFFPILFGSFFQQIYNTADAIIVGRFLGKIALSAVGGSSGMIVIMVVGFFVGLASGASVLVSQYYGASDEKNVEKTVHTVIVFSLLCGIAIMIVGYLLTPNILRVMKTPEETMEMSVLYLRVYFLGMVGNMIYNVGSGILRAVGDSRRPFLFLVVCCILNIFLDLVFVMCFHMGVFGVALATILSQAISAVCVLVAMIKSTDSYRLIPGRLKMDVIILKEIIHIGFPAGIQAVMYGISNVVIQVGVNGLGTDYVAAWATYYKIDGIFWMTVSAFGICAATFVGQNYGADRYDRVRKSVVVSLLQAMIASVFISVVVYLLCPWIFPIFTTDPTVKQIGIAMMRFLTPVYITYVSIEILSGALRGVGDTFVPMLISVVGICFLRSAWILLVMPHYNNMYTMMLSYPITWTITSVVFWIYTFGFSGLKKYREIQG